jgi:hypothetical protein
MQIATLMRRVARSETAKSRLTFVCLGLLLFVLACKCGQTEAPRTVGDNDNNSNRSRNDNDNKNGNKDEGRNSRQGKATAKDEGDFVVSYQPVQNPAFEKLDENFRDQQVLEDAARRLNNALSLPEDVTLTTRDCGQINAFYQSGTKTLTICYELMAHFHQLFRSQGLSQDQANREMQNAITFVFFHELGHGLIDLYDLGVTGKEEDAVDQLATYVTVEEMGDEDAAMAGAKAFLVESKNANTSNLPYYDEHSLGPQRFYNIVCWLYGYNPDKYQDIVDKGVLPESRAVRCGDEYRKFSTYWKKQLQEYRKN